MNNLKNDITKYKDYLSEQKDIARKHKKDFDNTLVKNNTKVKMYIFLIILLTIIFSVAISKSILALLLIIPMSEIVIQTIQYILGKVVKPKLIPKMKLKNGISKENATFVVIPTIVKTKEKVEELVALSNLNGGIDNIAIALWEEK